jgi:hypothetical protein
MWSGQPAVAATAALGRTPDPGRTARCKRRARSRRYRPVDRARQDDDVSPFRVHRSPVISSVRAREHQRMTTAARGAGGVRRPRPTRNVNTTNGDAVLPGRAQVSWLGLLRRALSLI